MSKFCGNCGAKLDDDAKVCGNCGTPVSEEYVKISDIKEVNPLIREKQKKMIKKIFITAVIIVSMIVIGIFGSQFIGYKGLIKKVMNAYKNYDIDTLVELSSDAYYFGDKDWVEYYFENTVGTGLDLIESSIGHNYHFSYEVKDDYEMSDRKTEELKKTMENSYVGFDVDIIEKIVVAEITITAKRDKASRTQNITVIMTKEDGEWRLYSIG